MASNGVTHMKVNHKILNDRGTVISYEANRCRCRRCNHSEYEKNPFCLKGFRQSILTANQLMIDLHDPCYNYTMLAEKNGLLKNKAKSIESGPYT